MNQLFGLQHRREPSPRFFDNLRNEVDEILADQNDINESTRAQLDAISEALAELQSEEPRQKPRRRIGFIQDNDEK